MGAQTINTVSVNLRLNIHLKIQTSTHTHTKNGTLGLVETRTSATCTAHELNHPSYLVLKGSRYRYIYILQLKIGTKALKVKVNGVA